MPSNGVGGVGGAGNKTNSVVFEMINFESDEEDGGEDRLGSPLRSPAGRDPFGGGGRRMRSSNDPWYRRWWEQAKWWLDEQQPERRRVWMAVGVATGLLLLWLVVFRSFKAPIAGGPTNSGGSSNTSTESQSPWADRRMYQDQLAKLPTVPFRESIFHALAGRKERFQWVSLPGFPDGSYLAQNAANDILVKQIHDGAGEPKVLAVGSKLVKKDSSTLFPQSMEVSPDGRFVLVSADRIPRWRHSHFASYYVYSVETQKTTFLADLVLYACWNPVQNTVAYVQNRDIFLVDVESMQTTRVTSDGEPSPNIFNGISDWVYEEEVLASVRAFWWSPTGKQLAFLRFDDTHVHEYPIQLFTGSPPASGHDHKASSLRQYPEEVRIKYPKPGTPNPIVQPIVFHLESKQSTEIALPKFLEEEPSDSQIIFDIAWLPSGDALCITAMNRSQDAKRIVHVAVNGNTTAINVHRHETTSSWFETSPPVFYLNGTLPQLYVDVVLDQRGLMQLGLFEVGAATPLVRYLTTSSSGEVVNGVLGRHGDFLFYIRTESQGTTRVLECVHFKTGEIKKWSEDLPDSYLDAKITPGGKWIVLDYDGPDVPYQAVVSTDASPNQRRVINNNDHVRDAVAKLTLPKVVYTTVTHPSHPDLQFNAKLTYPIGFAENRIRFYPLLVNTYNGPNSQTVNKRWIVDVHSYLASLWHNGTVSPFAEDVMLDDQQFLHRLRKRDVLNGTSPISKDIRMQEYLRRTAQPPFVILQLDVRGTGFRGDAFRSPVTRQLGLMEAEDVIAVVKEFVAKNRFVDSLKVGFWGWSFGGFLSSKIAEMDSESVFKACVAVAPVTNWLFYDSIYTERYMKLPEQNLKGYADTAIHQLDHFANLRFLVIHGTADDNVHHQQSLHLLHNLQTWNSDAFSTLQTIPPNLYRDHFVTDDRHSMQSTQGAFMLVHRLMVDWFVDAWKEVDVVRKLEKGE